MAVPLDIRSVKRPPNTIVDDSGSNGLYRYAVRERAGVKYDDRGRPRPSNGKVIGHIIDGQYVAVNKNIRPVKEAESPSLIYGNGAFVHSVSEDLFQDMLTIYTPKDAREIMAIASLKAMHPGITQNRLNKKYKHSIISTFYKCDGMTKNPVGQFFEQIGKDREKRKQFAAKRIASLCESDHIAIDGTLKQDTSCINSFSAFSYKGRVRGVKDISIIYAYSIEKREPLCAEVFPGNCIDASAFKEFIVHNDLQSGIILADKGFPVSQIRKELKDRPGLHYLSPIRRNDRRIKEFALDKFDDAFLFGAKTILCKKLQLPTGKYAYSFQDIYRAFCEKNSFVNRAVANNDFDAKKLEKKEDEFGAITFESDQNLTCAEVYSCYQNRWELEAMFDLYKHGADLTCTRVQSEWSIRGEEFFDLITIIITSRCVHKAEDAGVLKSQTYTDLLEDLGQIWRLVDAPDPPRAGDGYWDHEFVETSNIMVQLGLCQPKIEEHETELVTPKKTGRPKSEKKAEEPKKKRGRPRKITTEEPKPKRPVGRPRIHPIDPNKPKRGPGRPRKTQPQA